MAVNTDDGRVADTTGLSQAETSSTVSALTGFDPSRGTIHMRNGRLLNRDATWCGKRLLGHPDCDGDGIETFNVYGADVRTTYDEPFVTCRRCLDEFDASYRAAFPDGLQPIATISADNPRAKELLGPETMARFFGPNGEGAAAYEQFVAAIATETRRAETTGSVEDEGAVAQPIAQSLPPEQSA